MDRTHIEHSNGRAAHIALGMRGERLAAEYLESLGYRILARNWRDGREGELDLIASDGDYVIAVEVKARNGTGYGLPLESITLRKARRLRRLLLSWVRQTRPKLSKLRVDAVGITFQAGGRPRIDHVQGI